MLLANAEQAKRIDEITIEEYGVPGIALMENAGAAVARRALELSGTKYAVVCGKGNNGGDGFVAARHLFSRGARVVVVLYADEELLSGDAAVNFDALKKLGVPVVDDLPSDANVIIDAVLGIGAKGAPDGEAERAIDAINNAVGTVLSIDVPSGLDCSNGNAEGRCVQADVTVTFGVNKIGLAVYPGAQYAGRVIVEEISFAPQSVERQNITVRTIDEVRLPRRAQNGHKGSFGQVLALCGSEEYTGAAYLASTTALKSGCGLVRLGTPRTAHLALAQKLTEVIVMPLDDRDGKLSAEVADEIVKAMSGADAIICGCGLGQSDDIIEIVKSVIENADCPLVLDADGINALAADLSVLKGERRGDIVITPHLGEMSRLIGAPISEIQKDVVGVAKSFACEYNVVTVLKSAATAVALPNGEVYVNTGGNSGMATAGSGDVLAGLIGGFIAQGVTPSEAAVAGVYIHSLAGRKAAAMMGEHGMLASDILNEIPFAIKDIYNPGGVS